MKQLLTSFAAYDLWANERVLDFINSLTDEQQQAELASSFSSLHKTFLHVWDASTIWWQRLQQKTEIAIPSLSFHPDMKDVSTGLLQQNQQWMLWINESDEATLQQVLSYKNLKGTSFQQPLHEILLHLFNHGTYHRGQAVTMLRQLGIGTIPATDFIVFSRMDQ